MTDDPLPRGARILIIGGVDAQRLNHLDNDEDKSKLSEQTLHFARILGKELASGRHEIPIVVITGGRGAERSVDQAIVAGVRKAIDPEELQNRLITFPQPNTRLPKDFEGTRVIQSGSENHRVRCLEMVQIADAAISLAGTRGSRDSHLMAEALRVPVLPLPFTGGYALRFWEKVDEEKRKNLFGNDLMGSVAALNLLGSPSDEELTALANAIVSRVRELSVLRCFVMMPYRDPAVDWIYQDVVKPAIQDAGMRPIRSDETREPGRIIEQMLDQIRSSAVCVAVMSDRRGINPNVMYELGFAHALDIPSIVLAESTKDLSFDIRVERTVEYGSYETINRGSKLDKRKELREMLREARKSRRMKNAS